MLIAVASQNFRTVTGHAGKSRRFMVFDAAHGRAPQEVQRLDLPKEQSIHEFDESAPHPLDRFDAVIAGSAGAGFIARMAARGVQAVTTAETDPAAAVQAYVAGTLPPSAPHDHDDEEEGGCDCTCGKAG
ncbi:nitrogen fixation protein [Rhodopseudomonas sp. HC1]|uniref:NifB/NifX family molybdenum-iron cluster-binding protein n=1 Tax=Rhodopseudomonas infernalis TaxID=2897386 RepID=UPI001EE8C1C8|nr:NifB/NifX family molybdenum-iron cluster-binding protein [Rhodopseudomonas infernalis]MCG6207264.1 nitrogen fixation protein [Rhodopseudomonas infernalis]